MHIFEDLTERMLGGFFVYSADLEERILYANTAVFAMFGCTTLEEFMEHVGGSFRGVVYPDDLKAVEESILQQTASSKENLSNLVYRIQQKDGTIRWVEYFGRLVCTEEFGNSHSVFLSDITAKKQADDAALLCNNRFQETKNTLYFDLSKDIGIPVKAILGYAEKARKHPEDTASVKDQLEKVITAGNLLLALTNDLFDFSEFGANVSHPQMEIVDLGIVVGNALDMVRPEFEAKSIVVTMNQSQGEIKVLMDTHHFQRALLHMLYKAAKITPVEGSISLSIHQKDTSAPDCACFDVIVSGIGSSMSSELSPVTIEADRDLSVTKSIMDILGGNVWIKNEKEKGLTFALSLPLKFADGVLNTLPTKNLLYKASAKRRILLVEDIEMSRMMAEEVLMQSGFEVESVSDGRFAVENFASKPEGYYSAILMDIQMPVMNGYEATRAIRALDRKDVFSLPIIALSANARMDDKVQSYESGMNDHLAKPFDAESLIATLSKYLPEQ